MPYLGRRARFKGVAASEENVCRQHIRQTRGFKATTSSEPDAGERTQGAEPCRSSCVYGVRSAFSRCCSPAMG